MKKYFTILMLMLFSFCFISCNDINDLDKNEENKIEEKDPEEQKDPEQKDPEENKDPEEQKDPEENKELEELEKAYNAFLLEYPEYTGTIEDYKKAIEENDLCSLYGHKYQEVSREKYSNTEEKVIYSCEVCNKEKEVIEEIEIDNTNYEIKITGEKELYPGYYELYQGYTNTLTVTTTPECEVIWSSSNESIARVDQNGKVSGLMEGTVVITATSVNNPNCYAKFNIDVVLEDHNIVPYPNMLGYEIVIMTSESALATIDPFLDGYTDADKNYKQSAWRDVEEIFNCKITVKPYPDTAPWGDYRINWIIDNASSGESECDVAIVASNWIYKFAKADAAVDVTKYYKNYGKKQMEPTLKQAGTYKNKLYVASTGINQTKTYVDLGLFYNMAWLEDLGLEDPATMFNEGRWTYSDFEEWVMDAQTKIGNSSQPKRVLGGHPYYFYYGMTNAAGVNVGDNVLEQINATSIESKNACELIWKLAEAGCVNTTATWNESSNGTDFMSGDVLMGTGYLWYVRSSRWGRYMWGDDTRYGYVPFPYPDDVAKEDTRISVAGLDVYLYVNGREYPKYISFEDVYRAINEMFLTIYSNQKIDYKFDADQIKYDSLKDKIDNEASIEAIMYYDSSKVFYDCSLTLYDGAANSPIKVPAIDVMYKGVSFDEAFKDIDNTITTKLNEIYG